MKVHNASAEFSLHATVFRDRFSKGMSFYSWGLMSDRSGYWVCSSSGSENLREVSAWELLRVAENLLNGP